MPLNYEQARRFAGCKERYSGITTLIIREQLHNVVSYWREPNPSADHSNTFRLLAGLKTVYVQLCICSDAALLFSNAGWEQKLVGALQALIRDYVAINRVVIYYCGNQVHRSQPTFPWEFAKRFQGGVPDLLGSEEQEVWDIREDARMEPRFWITRRNLDGEKVVDLEFYTSTPNCGKSCVLA